MDRTLAARLVRASGSARWRAALSGGRAGDADAHPRDRSPLSVQAVGVELPELYLRVMQQGWKGVGPWDLISGTRFLDLHAELNARGSSDSLLVPLAARSEGRLVACLTAGGGEITLVERDGASQQAVATLPGFEAWLRLAVDDLIGGASTGQAAARPGAAPRESAPESRSATRRHLLKVLRESDVDLEFVEIEAGDRAATAAEELQHERVRSERGERLYADMLFVLAQQRFPDSVAKRVWQGVLENKRRMAEALGREVRVTTACLDYLHQHQDIDPGPWVLCNEEEMAQVADVALRDGLTGLFDQATFRMRLRREVQRVQRYGGSLTLLMLDLDLFKRLNDEHGHQEGDRVLAGVGDLLRDQLRAVDVPARYGGEEFAVLLPSTTLAEGTRLAERLREALQRTFAEDLGVTASLGLASHPQHAADAASLLAAADQALYRSKEEGRNRVSCALRPEHARTSRKEPQ